MVGLTLVTVVAVLGAGLRTSAESAVSDQVRADYILDGPDGEPFAAAEGEALAHVDGVRVASHVRSDQALVQVRRATSPASTRRRSGASTGSTWSEGSSQPLGQLGTDGALVTKAMPRTTTSRSAAACDPERLGREADGRRARDLRPAGDRADARPGQHQPATFDDAFPQPKNRFTFLDADPSPQAGSSPRRPASATRTCTPERPSPDSMKGSPAPSTCSTCCSPSRSSSASSGWSTRSSCRSTSARASSGCCGRSG